MRLLSVTVRNYRIHREITVNLDPARNLVGGPNECGKSTLMEAAHRALFLRAKITGSARDAMVSAIHAGAPEVEVRFQKNGREYHLTKVFRGATGTCLFRDVDGGASWQGDEAEERLAAVLGVEAAAGGRGAGDRVVKQWAHLWVWQGESGSDPAEYANAQRDALLARLQAGEAAAVLSSRDAAAVRYFKTLYEELFTKGGSPRRDSPWGRAEADLEKARGALEAARSEHDRLRRAAEDWEQAEAQAARAEASLTELQRQSAENARALEEAEKLKRLLERQELAERTAREAWDSLWAKHELILQLRAELEKGRRELETAGEETRRRAEAAEERRKVNALAEADWSAAQSAAREARMRYDLATARVAVFESRERHAALAEKRAEADGWRDKLNGLRQSLAALPGIDHAKLAELRELEAAFTGAEAELRGMAAVLEVVRADAPVKAGDTDLAAGVKWLLQEETVVRIGEGVELLLRPGGGGGLTAARQRAREAEAALRKALDAVGVSGVPEAAAIHLRRSGIEAEIKEARAVLQSVGADRLERELAEAEATLRAAEAEVARREAALEGAGFAPSPAPAGLEDARRLKDEAAAELQRAENRGEEAGALRAAAEDDARKAEARLEESRRVFQSHRERLAADEARLRLLMETHGGDDERPARLAELRTAADEAAAVLARTRRALEVLQPEHLEADRERLNRALERTEHERQEAGKIRAAAKALLASGGSGDPRETLALAEAAAAAAEKELERARRRAEAIRLLHTLFLEEQRSLAERFTRPLAERITGYLRCVFGPGARAEVALEDGSFSELKFVREGGPAFSFGSLSGGTREQVAAAMRLAMAELLAEDHGGCLPVVFDDAFTSTDPERVQTLQRMLDLAASRGLQIIVLTCNPADYAALGAEVVTLRGSG